MFKKLKRMWQLLHYTAPQVHLEYTVEDGIVFYRIIDKFCYSGSSLEFMRYTDELRQLANFENNFTDGQDTHTTKLSCGAIKVLIAIIRELSEGDRYTRPSEATLKSYNRVIDKLVDAIIYSYEHLPKTA